MAQLDEVFDSSTVPEREEFTPVPPGTYTAMIVASEIKETKSGGQMIVLEIDIMDGDHAGRKLFERLNIKNENAKAVEIAYRTLGEVVKAVGKTTIKNTDELHNRRMSVEVRVEPAKPYVDKDGKNQEGKPQNSIKKYMPFSGGVTHTAKSTAKEPEAVSTSSGEGKTTTSAPWARKKS